MQTEAGVHNGSFNILEAEAGVSGFQGQLGKVSLNKASIIRICAKEDEAGMKSTERKW